MGRFVVSPEVAAAIGERATTQLAGQSPHPSLRCWRCDGAFDVDEPVGVVVLRSGFEGELIQRVVVSHVGCGPSEVLDDPEAGTRTRRGPDVVMVPFLRAARPHAGVFVDHLVEVAAPPGGGVDLRTRSLLAAGFGLVTGSEEIVWADHDPVSDWSSSFDAGVLTLSFTRADISMDFASGPVAPVGGWEDAWRTGGLFAVIGSFRFAPGAATPDLDAVRAAVRTQRVVAAAILADT